MEDRLEHLFQEWHHLGAAVIVKKIDKNISARSPEEVLAESTAYCRNSGRLMWIVLDWLIHNIQSFNEDKLLKETKRNGNLSVLGLLCDLAKSRNENPRFDSIIKACRPNSKLEIFFHRVANSQLASRLTMENPLEVFSRWNFLCSELRYL